MYCLKTRNTNIKWVICCSTILLSWLTCHFYLASYMGNIGDTWISINSIKVFSARLAPNWLHHPDLIPCNDSIHGQGSNCLTFKAWLHLAFSIFAFNFWCKMKAEDGSIGITVTIKGSFQKKQKFSQAIHQTIISFSSSRKSKNKLSKWSPTVSGCLLHHFVKVRNFNWSENSYWWKCGHGNMLQILS